MSNKKGIPVYFVSSIFRKDQLFFKWYGGWYRKLLKKIFGSSTDIDETTKNLEINTINSKIEEIGTRLESLDHKVKMIEKITLKNFKRFEVENLRIKKRRSNK